MLKDQREARKALNILDEKLEKGVMSDERYKDRAKIHADTIARTTQLLESANTDAERWLELAKEMLSSAVNLSQVFDKVNDTERRSIMMFVGSNWYLSNKKVVLTERTT